MDTTTRKQTIYSMLFPYRYTVCLPGARAWRVSVHASMSLVFEWLVRRKTIRTTFTLKANTGRELT